MIRIEPTHTHRAAHRTLIVAQPTACSKQEHISKTQKTEQLRIKIKFKSPHEVSTSKPAGLRTRRRGGWRGLESGGKAGGGSYWFIRRGGVPTSVPACGPSVMPDIVVVGGCFDRKLVRVTCWTGRIKHAIVEPQRRRLKRT